jgi:Legume lectin domain/Chitobiase/beta-hexosaminidase C-terminal domain
MNVRNEKIGKRESFATTRGKNRGKVLRWMAVGIMLLGMSAGVMAQTNVTTQHNDIARTGANTNEAILTPANVNVASFGKLFSQPVDGRVYAQPLYVTGVTMGAGTPQAGTTHNVVFVATEHDSVYAFDADSNGGANSLPLWQVSLIDAAHGAGAGEKPVPNSDVSTGDIVPEVGITGTPVIDTTSKTIYVVAKSTVADATFIQRLHALDITTGQEKSGSPVALSGTVSGTGTGSSGGVLKWDSKWENNRPGLLLLNGIVYIGFAAHGDNGPWHGWILAYNATTLGQTSAYCTSPNGLGSGVWMSGSGLAADVVDAANKPYGRMFVATGNGTYDALTPFTNNMDYGDDHIRLDLTNGVITVQDSFTPQNQASLNGSDSDVASGGVLLLPDQSSGGHTHLLVQVGKEGKIYVVDRDNMGGYNATDNVVQEISGQTGGLWSMPAYWNNKVYFWGSGNSLKAFTLTAGKLSTTPSSTSSKSSGFPGATPSISSNGTTNGIVWALQTDAYGSSGTAVLRAFDATNVATELYDTTQNATRDTVGAAVKFAVPTVTNGKVYVGAAGVLDVYAQLGSAQQAAMPVINPVGQSFTGTLQVTITDGTTGATIYYTTDGSTPTTASTVYSGPITVNTTETISAVASGTGMLTSPVAKQTYTLSTQTLMPTFLPIAGSYTSAQSVTIADATPNSQIYYTTDGTTPSPGVGTTKLYATALPISATTTINAIATASGLSNSPVASSTYTINLGGTGIDFSNGFSTSASSLTFNGSTGLDDTRLQLTSGLTNQAGSAFYNTPVNIQSFTTDFTIQLSNPGADGITFTIQGNGPTALGPSGGGLGYGPDTTAGAPGIGKSVAVKFDIYSNAGEGPNSTGLYTNGASPTVPAIDLTPSGINLHSGDTMSVHLAYDGTTLAMKIYDPVANTTFTNNWTVNIPSVVGGNTAYVGFTGGTGGQTSSQKIGSWTFISNGSTATAATPGISPVSGTYTLPVMVTLSDSTTGASIHYTTDGSTPTSSSTVYTVPFALSGPTTVKAMATATGSAASGVASNTYAIQAATPIFSPVPGTYTASQSVTITDTTPLSVIYYTTNGTTPTTASSLYSGPVFVGTTETLSAIATAPGLVNSQVLTGQYTINSSGVTAVNLGSGFSAGTMVLNGGAALNGTRLRVTDTTTNVARSAWYNTPVNIQQFTTNFSFQITGGTAPTGDGFAFVIQGGASTSLGPLGGGLGYGPDTPAGAAGIGKSVAVKFDLYSNAGEGVDSTGLYTNGASPTTPAVDMTSSGVNLHTTDVFSVQITYDGTNLTMTITDATTNATFTHAWPVNIPSTVGGNAAYVGFTGGTGGSTAIQEIIGWTLTSSVASVTATPTFTPVAGTYPTTQNVTINDATSGAAIYYTTNGTTPTTASTRFTTPIAVATTQTIQAIAVASGFTQSAVGSATYTITPVTATPTFTPAAGTYTTAQSVAINDATSGAAIYYTTNGTTPTTASTRYTTPIAVATTQTIQAIAVATGFTQSAIGSAAYTITLPAATPTIAPATGTYGTAQTVTISDATSGATIYYTIDGSQPTTASPRYTGTFTVSSTTTVKAIATATGFSTSATASSVITIQGTTTAAVNFGSGFTATGMQFNGHTKLNGTRLQLTDTTATNEVGSAFWTQRVSVASFTNDFTFQLTSPVADGFTFTIQRAGTTAIGPSGGGLGYGPTAVGGTGGIPTSVAVKFDIYNNNGEGTNSTGLYVNGASPTSPATTLGNGVNVLSGHPFSVHMTYDGATLAMTITDTTNTAQTFTATWTVNIPTTIGGSGAYVGFTGGTGGSLATQEILTWTYSTSGTVKSPVVYQTSTLPAASSGPTFRTFTYGNFPDTTGTILDATAVGNNVTFTVNVATAGTYDIKLSYKAYNTRGISQLAINGTNVGATLDQYTGADAYATFDFGTFNFATAGNYAFKFTVTGKNASSSNYSISFDDLTLTPQ